MSLICRLVDSFFQGNCARGDIYDNNDYLQIECFQFCFFPLIQKELDVLKVSESRLASRPDVLYLVRDSSSDYVLKYDNQDILLVGEESCADKNNTPYICSDAFNKLVA